MPVPPPDSGSPIEQLVSIMATLRSPEGCPWDREQSLHTLKQYLLEETYEVLDAIDSGDRHFLEEELGDLLLQVVFQSQLCREEGSFSFDDVAANISTKLIRRHPHVFGDTQVSGSDEVLKNWEAIKKGEKKDERKSAVDGIPKSFPALLKADKLQKKVARLGFDWGDVSGVLEKVQEELNELRAAIAAGDARHVQEELGDFLFSSVNLSRFLGFNAEDMLNAAVDKFIRRFRHVEELLRERGGDIHKTALAELDALWNEVKAGERGTV